MLGAFFVKKVSSGVESAPPFLKAGLSAYLLGLAISVPFMNLTSYGLNYVGPIANLIGGADVSYFVGALAAFAAYALIARREKA
jgi:NCS1 family nucleobase:cation symporter-1